jgi:hypothetical protein
MFRILQFMNLTSSSRLGLACAGHVWQSFLWLRSKFQETCHQKFQVCYIRHFYLDLKKIKGIEIKIL